MIFVTLHHCYTVVTDVTMYIKNLKQLSKIVKRLQNPENLVNRVLKKVWSNKQVQQKIIDLNHSQLFSGIDSTGKELDEIGGKYSEITKKLKKLKNDPIDRTTLFDTGEYYDSFFVKPLLKGFAIGHEPIKDVDSDLTKRYGNNLNGLTKDSVNELIAFIYPYFETEFYNDLLR